MFWHSNAIWSQQNAYLEVKVPYPNFIYIQNLITDIKMPYYDIKLAYPDIIMP